MLGAAEAGPYHFGTETREANPRPIARDFGVYTLGAGLDLEAGGWLDDVALVGFLRASLQFARGFGETPPYTGVSNGADASLGVRGYWGLDDGGIYVLGDFGPQVRALGGGQNDIDAPDNVFDFAPVYGLRVAGGLGWRSSSGLDARVLLAVSPLFNDEAWVVPFGLEIQVGYGTP